MTRSVLSLLGRWHQWRRAYSHERGAARVSHLYAHDVDEDELERLTMEAIEIEIGRLAPGFQQVLQHVARAECMGVEVFTTPAMGRARVLETVTEQALRLIEKRLLQAGIL